MQPLYPRYTFEELQKNEENFLTLKRAFRNFLSDSQSRPPSLLCGQSHDSQSKSGSRPFFPLTRRHPVAFPSPFPSPLSPSSDLFLSPSSISLNMLQSARSILSKRIPVPLGRRYNSQLTVTCPSPEFFDSVKHESGGIIPAFRVLDTEGKISSEVGEEWRRKVEGIEPKILEKLMKTMSQLPILVSNLLIWSVIRDEWRLTRRDRKCVGSNFVFFATTRSNQFLHDELW